MICLLFGAQDLMIKNRLNKMLKERLGVVDDFNMARFDFNQSEIEDIILECTLLPLGSDRKAVVIDNAQFLSQEKTKKENLKKEEQTLILNYLKSPCESTDLFFVVHANKIDDKNEIVKKIKEVGKIVESVNPSDKEWISYAHKLFEKYHVKASMSVIEEFVLRTNNDALNMTSEIKKISLYEDEITNDVLDKLLVRPIDDNVFDLVNFIVSNKKKEAIRLYRDLLVKNEEPVALISLITNQIRFILDVLLLYEDGMSNDEIASFLKAHPYRVKIAISKSRSLSTSSLINELDNLYNVDCEIKKGNIDRFFALEMFIINFNKQKKT